MEANEQVLEFIKNNQNTNKPAISEGTGIRGLQLFNVLKKLQTDELITTQGEGQDVTYSISEVEGVTSDEEHEEIAPLEPSTDIIDKENSDVTVYNNLTEENSVGNIVAAKEEKIEDKPKPSTKGATRNNDKYRLNDDPEEYGKGGLVRAVIKLYVEQNPTVTYKQLKEKFPDTLMKRFGVFEEIAKAKELSGKRDRYFFKPEQIIKLGDKKQVAICSQWTAGLIGPFIETATKLGFKIN